MNPDGLVACPRGDGAGLRVAGLGHLDIRSSPIPEDCHPYGVLLAYALMDASQAKMHHANSETCMKFMRTNRVGITSPNTTCLFQWSHKLVLGLIKGDIRELAASLASVRSTPKHTEGVNSSQRINSAMRIANGILSSAKGRDRRFPVFAWKIGEPWDWSGLHKFGEGAIQPAGHSAQSEMSWSRPATPSALGNGIIRCRPATAPSGSGPGSSPPTWRVTTDRPWCRPDRRCCQGRI